MNLELNRSNKHESASREIQRKAERDGRRGLMTSFLEPGPIYCEVWKGHLLHGGLSVTNYIIYTGQEEAGRSRGARAEAGDDGRERV